MKQYRVTFDLNVSQNEQSLDLLKAFSMCLGAVELHFCSPLVHIDTDSWVQMRAIKEFRDVWNRLK